MVILVIATFLRLYDFTSVPPGLYFDEAMDGNNALEIAHAPSFWGALRVYYPEDNGREGLYVNAVAALIKICGGTHEPWIVRLPAAFSGILTVLGIYFLGAELFSEDTGLLAAFLLATSFWHINLSRLGFRVIMASLFLVWALFFLLKAIRSSDFRTIVAFSAIGGIVYGLGYYTYIAYRVTPLLLLLFIPFFARNRNFWRAAILFCSVAFLVALPIGLYCLHNPSDFFERTSQLSVSNSARPLQELVVNVVKTLAMFNFHGDDKWRCNISGAPELFWPVGVLFIMGMVLALRALWKEFVSRPAVASDGGRANRTFSCFLILSWFFIAMLPAALSNQGVPHALRSILMLPPAILFAAIGGMTLYRWLVRHVRAQRLNVAAILFLGWLAVEAYNAYFNVWARNPNLTRAFKVEYVTIGREINALPANLPKYVVVEAVYGFRARGVPVTAETTMFITDSFTIPQQAAENIHYISPDAESMIPPGSAVFYIR